LITKDGDYYTGDIHNGKFHGQGRILYAKNDDYEVMFEGEWKEGERITGTYIKSNFEWKYVGPFVKNLPHGEGEMTLKD